MFKLVLQLIISLLLIGNLFAQPRLRIDPDRVEFEDIFNRFDYTFLINRGDEILTIDSLRFNTENYIIDFEDGRQIPFTILPDDTVRMNVTLSNFYNIAVSDTQDTVLVFNNGEDSPEDLRIKIDFFDDDELGTCQGIITDTTNIPIQGAKVYFFYYGVYLIDSAFTDGTGFYSTLVPEGKYTIGAEKPGYRVKYYPDTYDPFFAQEIEIDSGGVVNLYFALDQINSTGLSVSGFIFDSTGNNIIDKGVVVVRKGTHVPSTSLLPGDSTVYSGFIRSNGSYQIEIENPGYYFVQSYSNYFLPGYFNDEGNASVFWQQADSININSNLSDKHFYLKRDSSFGGGIASGTISFSGRGDPEYDGITLIAERVGGSSLVSYNFGKTNGNFSLYNLPYGTYRLVAQQVGSPNGYSSPFFISPASPVINNVTVTFNLTGVTETDIKQVDFMLNQNYPNPFNPETKISWYSPAAGHHLLKVYDVLGNEVAVLVDEFKSAGSYEVEFDASNIVSGIYIYRIQSGNYIQSKKMILLK